MRRRVRYEGHVWLRSIDGETAPLIALVSEHMRDSIADCLHILAGRFGYLCELEQDVEAFHVRCFPVEGRRRMGTAPVALSYIGADLGRILRSAVLEASSLFAGQRSFEPSPREVQRWVAP